MTFPNGGPPRHFLHPCMIFAHREEHWVWTVLGSCVAVTLFDPGKALGGLNHYMLPLWNGDGLPTPKYGNVAMEKLLERVLGIGGCREQLVAKVFGGASLLNERPGPYEIGSRNVMVAREILARQNIPIIASNVGGSSGLRLFFNTRTGAVKAERLSQVGGGDRDQNFPGVRCRPMSGA